MARRRANPFAHTSSSKNAPKPIKIVVQKLDLGGLNEAYEWFVIDKRTAFKLAFEWFAANLTTLLHGDPLDEARQKSYDRAVKSKNIGDSTDYGEEQLTAYQTAVKLYEKTWPNKNLPKLDEAMAETKLSKRVENIQTVLTSLNGAFKNLVRFRMTFHTEREFLTSEILVPAADLQKMIPMTPLEIALAEVVTVAKVLSIDSVKDEEGNETQSLNGMKFMETLPTLLSSVAEWASGDRDKVRAIGKAPVSKTRTVGTPGTGQRATPRSSVKDVQSIVIINAAKMPKMSGKRRMALDTVLLSSTMANLKARLTPLDLKGYAGWALKTAVDAGAVEVK